MMHRRWMQARLRAYHDGSLTGPARTRLEGHLVSCAGCAGELRALEDTDALLGRCRTPAPALDPADAQMLFQAALSASGVEAGSVRFGSWRWRLAGAAVLATLGVAGYRLLSPAGLERGTVVTAQVPVAAGDAAGREDRLASGAVLVGKPVWANSTFAGLGDAAVERQLRRRRRVHRRRVMPPPVAETVNRRPEPALAAWDDEESPTLFVAVEQKPVRLQVVLTEAPPEAPGYAQVSTVRYEPTGQVVTQATVSSCDPDAENDETEPERPEERCGERPAAEKAPEATPEDRLPQVQQDERKEEGDACD